MNEGLLKDKSIGFIGAGKVGYSLGKLFAINNIPVTGYYSRHGESAKDAANFTDTKYFDSLESIVNCSDVLFLTVPDKEIGFVFQSIKDFNISNKYICHTSGALSSDDAFGNESNDYYTFSIHPLFPVSDKYNSYKELSDAFFCLEGNEEHIVYFEQLFSRLDIKTLSVAKENKIKYHAACAVASNLVCGIIKESVDLLMQCGFSESDALNAIKPLALSNIEHIFEDGLNNALTGPIERNDDSTVLKHINCFESEDDINLYKTVSKKVLEIAKNKNKNNDYSIINNLINKEN